MHHQGPRGADKFMVHYHVIGQIYAHTEVLDKAAKCGVVGLCDMQFPTCNQHYIGETARPLGTPVKEHLSCREPLSVTSEHNLNTGYQCSMRDVKENWHRRKTRGH